MVFVSDAPINGCVLNWNLEIICLYSYDYGIYFPVKIPITQIHSGSPEMVPNLISQFSAKCVTAFVAYKT